MSTSIAARIALHNGRLAARLEGLAASQGASEICAIEATTNDGAERSDRRGLLRAALSDGSSPRDLGLTFVVGLAECAYEVDWGDQFSFWPQIATLLNAPKWDPTAMALRAECTAAFQVFAAHCSALKPQGRFAECYTHVSWPLFHAVLPRAAHRRMTKLLSRAAADPRFVVEAGGAVDERELSRLLRDLASRTTPPAYFEGILQHPTLPGRLGIAVLRAMKEQLPTAVSGLGADFVGRVLADLQDDRVAREELELAAEDVERKEEAARRRQRAAASNLDPIRLALTLDIDRDRPRLFVELGPIDASVREWAPFAELLVRGEARVAANVGGVSLPGGYLANLAHGAISLEARWPAGRDKVQLAVDVVLPAGRKPEGPVVSYVERSRREVKLPILFEEQGGGHRFAQVRELKTGANVALLQSARAADALRQATTGLGLREIDVFGSGGLRVFTGVLRVGGPGLVDLARLVGLSVGSEVSQIRPALIPPVRSEATSASWLDEDTALVQVLVTGPPDGLRLTFDDGTTERALSLLTGPTGALLAQLPDGAGGTLILRRGNVELARLRASRQPRPVYRETTWRSRVAIVPSRATRAHLFGDACGLRIEALSGVHLKLELFGGVHTVEELLSSESATLMETAALIRRLRERIEQLHGADAALLDYELRISSFEEPDLPPFVHHFAAVGRTLGFDVTSTGAVVRANVDADLPTLSRLTFEPNLDENKLASLDAIVDGATEGIYLARSGAVTSAIAWAADVRDLPRSPECARARRGPPRSVELAALLRASGAAALGPPKRIGRAVLLRRAAVRALERELVMSLCGSQWGEREERIVGSPREIDLDMILKLLAPLLWVPRTWLDEDLPRLLTSAGQPIEVLEQACEEGVGDVLTREDARLARHLLLLFARAQMAAVEEDRECMAWSDADVTRPRLVRLFLVAGERLARRGEADRA